MYTGATIFGIWLAAFLTLCIFSFLFKDNPFYKLAEHLFVGVSAGYQMVGPASGNFVWGNVGDLATALDGGISLGARFIEVYQADCDNPEYASLLTAANARLLSQPNPGAKLSR